MIDLHTLLSLRAAYQNRIAKDQEALKHIQALIALEGGQAPLTDTDSGPPNAPNYKFDGVSNAEAAFIILRDRRKPMGRKEIFDRMKECGHPITSEQALSVALSNNPLFKSEGKMWTLANPSKPPVELLSTDNPPFDPEDFIV